MYVVPYTALAIAEALQAPPILYSSGTKLADLLFFFFGGGDEIITHNQVIPPGAGSACPPPPLLNTFV